MTIQSKVKLFLPLLSVVLLIISYNQFVDGYNFKEQMVVIDSSDMQLMQEMRSIEGISELETVDKNVEKFIILAKSIFGIIGINTVDNSNVKNINNIDSAGIDKIGEFRDLVIRSKGDYLQQVYLLKQVNESMRNFVIINKMQGTNKEVIVNVRVYGHSV